MLSCFSFSLSLYAFMSLSFFVPLCLSLSFFLSFFRLFFARVNACPSQFIAPSYNKKHFLTKHQLLHTHSLSHTHTHTQILTHTSPLSKTKQVDFKAVATRVVCRLNCFPMKINFLLETEILNFFSSKENGRK
jgi:hypothetical protein